MIPKIHCCYFDLILLIMNYEEGPDDCANESVNTEKQVSKITPMTNIYRIHLCIA